jgi:hypothetical protein
MPADFQEQLELNRQNIRHFSFAEGHRLPKSSQYFLFVAIVNKLKLVQQPVEFQRI